MVEPSPGPGTEGSPATDGEVFASPPEPAIIVQAQPHRFEMSADERTTFERLAREYSDTHERSWRWKPHDAVRVMQLMSLIEQANAAPPGDYGEFGCHCGLVSRVIHQLMDPSSTLHAFDTFEGFKEADLSVERKIYLAHWYAGQHFPAVSPESVAHYVGDGRWPENLKIYKGWFPKSFEGLDHLSWRFVHIDFDLYQPIKTALERLWPRIVPGGVCVVHDYGCQGFPGAKMAVDEFFDGFGLTPMNLGDRWGSIAVIKPKDPVVRKASAPALAFSEEQAAVRAWTDSVTDRLDDPSLGWGEIVELCQAHRDAFPGYPFPLHLEKRALDLQLEQYPDRDDLRRRQAEIEKLL